MGYFTKLNVLWWQRCYSKKKSFENKLEASARDYMPAAIFEIWFKLVHLLLISWKSSIDSIPFKTGTTQFNCSKIEMLSLFFFPFFLLSMSRCKYWCFSMVHWTFTVICIYLYYICHLWIWEVYLHFVLNSP